MTRQFVHEISPRLAVMGLTVEASENASNASFDEALPAEPGGFAGGRSGRRLGARRGHHAGISSAQGAAVADVGKQRIDRPQIDPGSARLRRGLRAVLSSPLQSSNGNSPACAATGPGWSLK